MLTVMLTKFGVRVLALLTLLTHAIPLGVVWAGSSVNSIYSEALECGPKALFVFLLLSGRSDVRLEQLKTIPMTEEGSSMMDLCRAANQFGIKAEVRRYSAEDIQRIPLPAIVRMRNDGHSDGDHHYLVLYKADAHNVYGVDPSLANKKRIAHSRFCESWSGEAIAVGVHRILYALRGHGTLMVGVACLIPLAAVLVRSSRSRATYRHMTE